MNGSENYIGGSSRGESVPAAWSVEDLETSAPTIHNTEMSGVELSNAFYELISGAAQSFIDPERGITLIGVIDTEQSDDNSLTTLCQDDRGGLHRYIQDPRNPDLISYKLVRPAPTE